MLGRINAEPAVDGVDSPRPQGLGAWCGGRAARTDVEASLMERTFDLGSHDETIGQRSRAVRTLILSDIELPVQAEDSIGRVVHQHPDGCIGLDLGGGT
jgi:hypothetical protein